MSAHAMKLPHGDIAMQLTPLLLFGRIIFDKASVVSEFQM
jgi:hypothetical protein